MRASPLSRRGILCHWARNSLGIMPPVQVLDMSVAFHLPGLDRIQHPALYRLARKPKHLIQFFAC